MTVELTVDDVTVIVDDGDATLLTVLREQVGKLSVKDGCSPQGQCGCCTVLVDGQARVACVTPVRRVAGREIRTLEGLPDDERQAWADAFVATGGSQCGFCTPGIICRFSALRAEGVDADDRGRLGNALAAHLCRCTGWQTILEAYEAFGSSREVDSAAANRRAAIEGGTAQVVGPHVALGSGGFSADTPPEGTLVAVRTPTGGWATGETLSGARRASGKVQGRRTTIESKPPIEAPAGDWALTLHTSWVEPAHLETESVWCRPGGEPSSLVANGGAFGAKVDTDLGSVARSLADRNDRPVLVSLSREDSVQTGAKRPPIAAGLREDGSGELIVARTPGIAAAISAVAPRLAVSEVDIVGPPTSAALRGAGWVEAAVLIAALEGTERITAPNGAAASASIDSDGIHVIVDGGASLDAVVLRSYCIGAAHMAYSWVTSESLAVDDTGNVHDLTIRSFGVVRASDMPTVHVDIEESDAASVNGSDAVFAAVALAAWRSAGLPPRWPTGR